MAYNYNRPPNPNEFPKNHPKWYGVPAKGEVPPVNRDLIIVGGIIITIEIALAILFTDTNFQLGIVVFAIAVTVLALVLWFVLWRDKGFADTKYPFVIQIFFIILLEICIWAVYRNLTADYFGQFGTMRMYAFHIVAAPTIHLLPIYFAWKLWWGERGLPFQFSKKLIMSGVIVGFSGAIIWRLLQQFVWAGFASAAGGTVPGTFTFLNVLETPALFGIMSFVHFCVVGPVEELEFRGFTQDQAARVLPNYQAVIFSSVLFGCSHIPIAIFLYQFPTQIFVIALVGWISAGFVFGFLYMWSRSIWACIVMHGMGNWQLSVYYFSSDSVSGWGMTGAACSSRYLSQSSLI